MVNSKLLSRIALAACFFAFVVIGLGAFTRLIDAGLGCPDWPGCYGHLVVPTTLDSAANFVSYKAWAEMLHRYAVLGLSLFILVIIGLIVGSRVLRQRMNISLAVFLLFLLFYQIMLGQWTVTLKLLPIIVTQHLLGGFLILASLWLIYLNNAASNLPSDNRARGLIPWAILGLVLLLLQIMLGAWTSTNYAALSCPGFPFCMNHQSLPSIHLADAFPLFSPVGVNYEGGVLEESIRQTIQMLHRLGALIVTTYMVILAVFAASRLKNFLATMQSIFLIIALLFIQVCLGIINVIFKLPLATAIMHNLVAVLLLLAMITFVYKLVLINRKASAL